MMWNLLKAEAIKLRRTSAPIVVIAAPVLVVILQLGGLFSGRTPPVRPPGDIWNDVLKRYWVPWLAFFLPTLVSFVAASLANLEHNGNQWKQLFVYPLPRWTIYATKMICCAVLCGASGIVFAPLFVGSVLIYSAVYGLNLATAIPVMAIIALVVKTWLASWLMIALQTWISARISGFGVSLGIGVVALVFGFMLIGIHENAIAPWYPWTLALSSHPANPVDYSLVIPVLVGSLGGLIAGVFACRDLAERRERV